MLLRPSPGKLLAATALLSVSLAAHADEFSYTLTDPNLTFSLISPTLITTLSTALPAISCEFGGSPCNEVTIGVTGVPAFEPGDTDPGFEVFENGSEIGGITNSYPSGFFTVGTHTYEADTLTIVDIPTVVTPEPSSLALLGTGVLAVAGVLRKRFV